jgi:hypothetical protein
MLEGTRTQFARRTGRFATAISAPLGERRVQRYVKEATYYPIRGLGDWVASRSDDRGVVADAIRPFDGDVYRTRTIDIREPALLEHRRGYVFLRHGVYRPSFNWWQFDEGPHVRAFADYARWLVRPGRVAYLAEAVSFRTRWEENYWHCHDEVLSKLLLVDRMGLASDVPLLIAPRLWDAPFFQDMVRAPSLRDRNWVVHDTPIWSKRLILCIQGPTSPDSPRFTRDLFRDPDVDLAPDDTNAPLLFVNRPATVERHLANDGELRDALATLGFDSIEPERLTFWEQVERFRAARCVVTPHGAAFANLVHRVGRPTGVVEIFPDDADYVGRVYGPWLSRESGFAYRALVGSPMSGSGAFTVSREAVVGAVSAVLREVEALERA